MFNKIYNPETERFVNVNGNTGKKVINNYVNYLKTTQIAGSTQKINNKKKHIKIFHAHWCYYCRQSMDIFKELVNKDYKNFYFTLHDVDEIDHENKKINGNDIKRLGITSFPTIIWDKGTNEKNTETYEGHRTKDKIINWANELSLR